MPAVEAVGLWDVGLFQRSKRFARQIHSLPLVLPMLLPALRRLGLGAYCSRRGGLRCSGTENRVKVFPPRRRGCGFMGRALLGYGNDSVQSGPFGLQHAPEVSKSTLCDLHVR
jgi:hypothetical protein